MIEKANKVSIDPWPLVPEMLKDGELWTVGVHNEKSHLGWVNKDPSVSASSRMGYRALSASQAMCHCGSFAEAIEWLITEKEKINGE